MTEHEPSVPPGYSLSRPTLEDAPEVAAMRNAVGRELLGHDDSSTEEVIADWTSPESDMSTDDWLVRDDAGAIVAGVGVWAEEPYARLQFDGYVHPEHTGRGIGSLLVSLAEARAREFVPRAPDGIRVTLDHGLYQQDAAGTALMAAHGFEVERTFYRMERDLTQPVPAPRFPDHVVMRDFDPDADPHDIYEAIHEAFRDHWGESETTFEMWSHDMLGDPHYDPSLWVIAVDRDKPDRIAGAAIARMQQPGEPDLAWVATLGVRRPWRGTGVGRALLLEAFTRTKAKGAPRVGLGVDSENPLGALRLYESVGMVVDEQINVHAKVLRPGRPIEEAQG